MKIRVFAILLIHRVLYLAMPIDEASIDDKYYGALEYCSKKGPMEMPSSYESCHTVGGPKSDQPCKFPFYWKGTTYHGCPVDPDDRTKYWCSTKVDSSGNHIVGQGEYGDCSEKCPIQDDNFIDQEYHNEYQCHTLLQQGPCQSNYWFVANNFTANPIAECQKRICKENEILFHNECHKNDSNTLCGESQILLMDPFGEGECHCQNDFLEYYDNQNKLNCYQENSQGPCAEGQKFIQPNESQENGRMENATCILPGFSVRKSIFNTGNGFENSCENGKRRDETTGKCEETYRHSNNVRRSIGGHKNVLELCWNLQDFIIYNKTYSDC